MQAAPQRAGEGKANRAGNVSSLVAFIFCVCVSVCRCMIVIEDIYMGDVSHVG